MWVWFLFPIEFQNHNIYWDCFYKNCAGFFFSLLIIFSKFCGCVTVVIILPFHVFPKVRDQKYFELIYFNWGSTEEIHSVQWETMQTSVEVGPQFYSNIWVTLPTATVHNPDGSRRPSCWLFQGSLSSCYLKLIVTQPCLGSPPPDSKELLAVSQSITNCRQPCSINKWQVFSLAPTVCWDWWQCFPVVSFTLSHWASCKGGDWEPESSGTHSKQHCCTCHSLTWEPVWLTLQPVLYFLEHVTLPTFHTSTLKSLTYTPHFQNKNTQHKTRLVSSAF